MLTQLFPTLNDNQLIKLIKKGINSIELVDYNYGLLDFSDHKIKFYAKLLLKNFCKFVVESGAKSVKS